MTENHGFKVWKTIKIGTHKTVKDLCEVIKDSGCEIADYGHLLGEPTFDVSQTEEEIDLVLVVCSDLTSGQYFGDLCDAAKSNRLKLCPPEVALQLRIQYLDQPHDQYDFLRVASEPIENSWGFSSMMNVFNDATDEKTKLLVLLSEKDFDLASEIDPNSVWVFILPRES